MPGKPRVLRTVVVPEPFFSSLGTRLFKDFGPLVAENILYEMGREAGRDLIRIEERATGKPIRNDAQIRAVLRKFGTEYRWANIAFKELDVDSKFAVVVWKNGVGVPKGGSSVPVCHMGRGLLSGAAEIIFGGTLDAIETQCQGMGQEHCEIVVGSPERILRISENL